MIKMFTKRMNNRKGFTLIELIVVIAILGILAAIAIPRFSGFQASANVKSVAATLRTIETAGLAYASEKNLPLTSIDYNGGSPLDAVETDILALIGSAWPSSPSGVNYTLIDGVGYAKVDTTAVAWPSGFATPTDTTNGYILSELD